MFLRFNLQQSLLVGSQIPSQYYLKITDKFAKEKLFCNEIYDCSPFVKKYWAYFLFIANYKKTRHSDKTML